VISQASEHVPERILTVVYGRHSWCRTALRCGRRCNRCLEILCVRPPSCCRTTERIRRWCLRPSEIRSQHHERGMGGPCRLNGRAGADAAMADAREVASGKIRVPRTDLECLRDGAAPRGGRHIVPRYQPVYRPLPALSTGGALRKASCGVSPTATVMTPNWVGEPGVGLDRLPAPIAHQSPRGSHPSSATSAPAIRWGRREMAAPLVCLAPRSTPFLDTRDRRP
jgi:hypothetical protein